MNRDPFYQKILDRLTHVTDGNLFERCAVDLLREDWPSLVPVPGGDDAGLDGAWADERGAGFVVATIAENVIGNVRRNLNRHLEQGDNRRRVLVATTRELTRRRCTNIKKVVQEFGFELANYPYTREAIAILLYRNSRWCRELLGIAGLPPALSKIPKVLRYLRDLPLLHREDDYQWVKTTLGDRILVGHPGVGKTYLLQQYVNEGNALFVTDDDMGRITDAIRDQQATALIIEDAHLWIELIEQLRHYREETGLPFSILADCWPATHRDAVCGALAIGSDACRTIEPLPAKQIADVIRAAGISDPNVLMERLIRQSGGYPGRAAMLVQVCLTNNIKEVWDGTALARWVHTTFSRLVEEQSIRVLAGFAFGGKEGMKIDAVARILGYAKGQIYEWLAKLCYGGIVQEIGQETIRVVPEPLRCALVKEYFFDRTPRLSLDEFVESATSLDSALESLIGAHAAGAAADSYTLVGLLKRTSNHSVWEGFVGADAAHGHIILDDFPEKVAELARPLLYQVPDRTIPHLLGYAVDDHRQLHSAGDHPLRLIQDWVECAEQGSRESVRRRRTLLASVKECVAAGHEWSAASRALPAVLSPYFEDRESMADDRLTFRIRNGSVWPPELQEIAGLWSDVYELLKTASVGDWSPIFGAIDQWIYWHHPIAPIPEEVRPIRDATARRMLTDLQHLAIDRPSIQKQLRRRANDIGLSLEFAIDREFLVLFPEEDYSVDWKERQRRDAEQVKTLAAEWIGGNPEQISTRLAQYVSDAKASGKRYPDYSGYTCSLIAADTPDVLGWLAALTEAGAESQHLAPFVERAVNERPEGWSDQVAACLRSEKWRRAAVPPVLKSENVDAPILEDALRAAKECPDLVEHLCMTSQIADERIACFLKGGEGRLREAVAVGLWHREPARTIPGQLLSAWRCAVIADVSDEYDLCEMLRADGELAFQWMIDRATNDRNTYYREAKAYVVAAEHFSDEQKRVVIDNVNPTHYCSTSVIRALVGTSRGIYQYLLTKQQLKQFHLSPLGGKPTSEWCDLGSAALDAGYTPRQIASVAFRGEASFGLGSISSREEEEMRAWENLASHNDARIREVARIGSESARRLCEFWKRREEAEEFDMYYG